MFRDNDPIDDRLDKISEAIVFLTEKVSSLEARINKEEGIKKAPHIPIDIPPKPMYKASMSDQEEFDKPEINFVSGGNTKFYVEKEKIKEIVEDESIESEIGLKWLGRIGVLALVIGVGFFLKYAFDNDWIGETGRVAIGILFGMGLIVIGDYLRQKYAAYAAVVTGGGIAVLYLATYSSFAYYQLIEQLPAFVAMAVITAFGAFLAVRQEQINLAVLSILGGFLTPVLLSTGTNNQIGLFGYMTVLNLGILAISFYRNWHKLNLLGFLATIFLYFGWAAKYYDSEQLLPTEAFLTLWFIIYSVAIVSHNILSKKKTEFSDLVLIVLNGFAYFGISYLLFTENYSDYLGFFTVLMAVAYFVFAYISFQVNPEDKKLALFFPGISIFFLTIAAPIQLDGAWITISWAIEAIAIAIAGFYLKSYEIRFFARVLLGIVAVRLIFVDSHEAFSAEDYVLVSNMRFLVFTIGVVSFSAVYYLYSRCESLIENKESRVKAVTLFLLNFLLLWNLSAEVSNYFNNQIRLLNEKMVYPLCQNYDFNGRYTNDTYCAQQTKEYYAEQEINILKIRDIQSTENTSRTVLWALYAIIIIAFGIRGKNKFLRLMGIGLFGIVIVKLFLYDLWSIGGVWRIVAPITLGVILLAASFAYNKYREKIKEII